MSIFFISLEFSEIKKPDRGVNEILDNLFNICDENTKYELDFIIKDKIDITSIRNYNFLWVRSQTLINFIIVILLKYCFEKKKKKIKIMKMGSKI